MSRICALRSVLALAIILLVTLWAVPAYPWHGTGNITALAIDPVTPTTVNPQNVRVVSSLCGSATSVVRSK